MKRMVFTVLIEQVLLCDFGVTVFDIWLEWTLF